MSEHVQRPLLFLLLSCFFYDIVPNHVINAHLKMWPPPGTLTDVQFPDTVPTKNLFAGDSLKKTWPRPHSLPIFSFPFQVTLEKCSLITEYKGDFASIPTCCPPSHPENLISRVICFSALFFLFPQSLISKKFDDLAKLYMSWSTRHHFLCSVTLGM